MNAPDKATEIKAALAAIIAFLSALWGWLGWLVIIWIACIILDYISGSMAAKREKNWSSDIAREGLWHKAGEIIAVLAAALCDIALKVIMESSGIKLPFEFTAFITPVVLLWYILTEVGSILENSGRLGGPMPSWFKQKIDSAKNAIDRDQSGTDESTPMIEGQTAGKHEKQEE
ncbi:MAG: phage holin family protein [Oscillospiraceae bacterium]|nr:phage holin family protein [Oscillospiraceae bacterium]